MSVGVMSDPALSVPANSVSANIYAGKPFEFISPGTVLRVRMSAAAVGLQSTILAGGAYLMLDQAISQSNRWPVLPDDMTLQTDVPGGGRLIHTVRNTTVGAITFNHVTEVIT